MGVTCWYKKGVAILNTYPISICMEQKHDAKVTTMRIPDEVSDFWVQVVGLKASALVAGMAGALISMMYEKELSPRRAVVLLLVGTFCAGYVTPLLSHLLHLKEEFSNSLSFLIGLTGMRIFHVILMVLADYKLLLGILTTFFKFKK